jgi:hypothetical protein
MTTIRPAKEGDAVGIGKTVSDNRLENVCDPFALVLLYRQAMLLLAGIERPLAAAGRDAVLTMPLTAGPPLCWTISGKGRLAFGWCHSRG